MQKPLISIIIPAYNGELYLAKALQSIEEQTCTQPKETWIIDNGSTDHTRLIAQSFPWAHYHYSKKLGTARARNLGIQKSTGTFIAFLDQDDVWSTEKLEKQVSFLQNNPEVSAVISLQQMFLESEITKPHWLKQEFLEKPQAGYLPSALMIRRSALLKTNVFDPDFPSTSDVAWFLKAKHQGLRVEMIPEVLLYRRIHSHNDSHHCKQLQEEMLRAIQKSLHERRSSHLKNEPNTEAPHV